jgi:anthranilate synthase component 1
MFFLNFGDIYIAGSSPEMLVKVWDGIIETRPIAGTRPRGKTPNEDKVLEKELLSDEKELAEHIMLVDLARNDLGRVSKYGSVKVNEYMVIEKYSHVMHIVSDVTGELKEGAKSVDVMKSVFPAGTVSGAPKVRAMEIIDELENIRRGPYAGVITYFSYNGNMDSAITLRTMIAKGNKAYVQAGAGIVYDSIPESEYNETINKAKAVLKAVEMAKGGQHAV